MKFFKKTRKGFTLVELIVVIAIVAILAAVSVVSYLAFINQANESADVQLVKQLNVALQADETLNGPRDTMKEMLEGMEKQGFVVENLTKTKSGYDIVWDQQNNRFALLNSEDKAIYSESSFSMNNNNMYSFWKFADTEGEASNKKYSVYLTDEFKDVETLTVGAGLDVGNYVGLTEVTYDNSANNAVVQTNVILNTNGGKLIINGPKDTVTHRGYAKSVDIIAVDALNSYHEYGEVGFTQIEKGHYVGEEGAKVTVLLATGSASDVTIDNNGADIEKAYTTDETAKDTQHGGNESLEYYEVTATGDQTVEEAIEEAIESLETGATFFAGGTGTESDPFLISNREELLNTGNFYYQNSFYFKVKEGIKEIDCSNWEQIEYFGGSLDGNGVTLTGLDKPLIDFIWDGLSGSTATFKNINVVCNMHYNVDRGALITYTAVKYTVFDNVNISGLIESSMGCSAYIAYGAYGYNYYYFNNCVSDVALIATGGAASGFVNHPGYNTSEGSNPSINAKIFITDSIYNGKMSATGNSVEKNLKLKYFVVNSNGLSVTTKYSDEFIQANGNPEGTLYNVPTDKKDKQGNITVAVINNEDGSKTFNAGNYGSNLVDYYRPSDANNMKSVLVSMDVAVPAKGSAFEFAKVPGANRVVVTLEIGANDENGYGNYVGTYEIEEINVASYASGATISTSKILNFIVVVEPANTSTRNTGASGAYYYVVSNRNGSTYGSAVVRITQYDANGNVIGTKAISIAE